MLTLRTSLTLLGVLCAAAVARAQDPNAQPGPVHQEMARLAGDYTTTTKFTLQPGTKPEESKGTAKLSMILGGRYLKEESEGTMMGQKFSAFKMYGFNNAAKQFEGVWTYTGGTALMTLTGKSENDGRNITWTGTYADEAGQKKTLHVVTRIVDEDNFVVSLHMDAPEKKSGPVMETAYSRKK